MFGRKILGIVVAILALGGCATDRTFGTAPGIEVTQLERLPEPRNEIFYTIGPQETLNIQVIDAPTLSGTFLTNEQGNVGFPLLGVVELGGKSPSEASDLIANGLRGRYLLDPQVRVIPTEFPPPSISVGGQVEMPGSYPALGRPTLLRVHQSGPRLGRICQIGRCAGDAHGRRSTLYRTLQYRSDPTWQLRRPCLVSERYSDGRRFSRRQKIGRNLAICAAVIIGDYSG